MASAFFWEDGDQLNLIATFLDAKSIGSIACVCRFVRDNLRDDTQLRWLAELRGLDPATTHIGCVAHIEIAEAMADLETNISFGYGSIELEDEALPSVRRMTDMLRRHTALSLSIEAHCGLEAQARFAEHFTRRRALAVRSAMEEFAEQAGAPDALAGRLHTRAWGNSRPVIWAHGEEAGEANRRVELYLSHGEFEAPKRRQASEYARRPGAPAPAEEADTVEAEAEAVKDASFDADTDMEDEEDWGYGGRQQVMVQLPDGRQVVMPLAMLHQLQQMDQAEAMAALTQLLERNQPGQHVGDDSDDVDDRDSDEEDQEGDQDAPSIDVQEQPAPEPGPEPEPEPDGESENCIAS
jgi:outer membrane protein OmpA-like peptidoglycan-associated protein